MLVAVEAYEAGTAWNLDGPVRDVLAYRDWLLDLGLAAEAVTVLAAPLPHHRALLEEAGVRLRPADRESVHRVLFREVAAAADDWLCVVWSGHGLVDLDGHRRLVYADAAPRDLRSLDLEAALAAYRSDVAPAHPEQLWLVDACQTFTDAASAADALRPDPVPRGRLRAVPGQRVLFACEPGRTTANRAPGGPPGADAGHAGAASGTRQASGAFSTAVLDLLRTHPQWRHDATRLGEALRERFRTAAANGTPAPVPTTLWFGDAGNETRAHGPAPARPAGTARRLGLADHRRIYEALAELPVLRDPGLRSAVIGHLPPEIGASVPRSPVMRVEILELIRTCLVFRDGLGHLWESVALLDAGTAALDELEAVLKDYPEWFTPV